MKRRIRLTESDIRNIVKRSVKRILKEDVGTPDMEGRWFELCWRLDEKQMQNAMYSFLSEKGLLEEFINTVASNNGIDSYTFEDDANDAEEW